MEANGLLAPQCGGDCVRIPLKNGGTFGVSQEDAPYFMAKRWRRCKEGYIVERGNCASRYAHRQVLGGPPDGFVVDHWDGDKAHCCRGNLRWVTVSLNRQNRPPSGRVPYRGVWLTAANRRAAYRAVINLPQHRQRSLGSFSTAEEAALAYNRAALERWGPMARLNEVADRPVQGGPR